MKAWCCLGPLQEERLSENRAKQRENAERDRDRDKETKRLREKDTEGQRPRGLGQV